MRCLFLVIISTLCMVLGAFLTAQEKTDDAWIGQWVNAVKLAKDKDNYLKALHAYTTALESLIPGQTAVQLNLLNERGNLYLQIQDYPNAINDFSSIVGDPKANQEQKIEAFLGRSKAYLGSGNIPEFEKDRSRVDQLQAFITPIEETKTYSILKVSPYIVQDSKSKERFVKVFLKRKEIKSEKDVTFTPSGLVIVKKAKAK